MRLRKILLWIFTIPLVIILLTPFPLINFQFTFVHPVFATPDPAKVYLDPPSLINTSAVVGEQFKVNLTVDFAESVYGFQFELIFNPDVINGVYPDLGNPTWPFELGPFLESAGGIANIIPGVGWNNTMGRLWLTAGALLMGPYPTGGGVLATITFDVVGLGESEISLGGLTRLKNSTGDWIATETEDGYFRNIDSALIPTASFASSPVGTPVPLEGYNTSFTSTSTPAPSRTIVAYKWFLWIGYRDELDGPIETTNPVTHNYTLRGTWNVTLTVTDDIGVVGTITGYIEIKAHDMYIIDIATNTSRTQYPLNLNATDIGDVMQINVTVVNEGDFTETNVNVTSFWHGYYAGDDQYGAISTQYGLTLAAGANTTLVFYWDTTGRNLTHALTYDVRANVSRVQYEYDTEWRTGVVSYNEFAAGASFRIRMHDVAVTDVAVNATSVSIGGFVEVEVTVVNQGDFNETGLTVTAYYDATPIGSQLISLMTNESFALMEPGFYGNETITLTFNWNTITVPYGNYTISISGTGIPDDYEPYDNTATPGAVYVIIPGDMTDDSPGVLPDDPDGDVDGFDLGAFADAYGSSVGQPNYDVLADLTDDSPGVPPDLPDGDVDGFDLGVFADNYGSSI